MKYPTDDQWSPVVERCGFILLDGSLVEVKNQSLVPEQDFIIGSEDQELFEGRVWATWHSHPSGNPNLSFDDYRLFLRKPEWCHFIVGCGKVWGYSVLDSKVILHAQENNFPRIPPQDVPRGDRA